MPASKDLNFRTVGCKVCFAVSVKQDLAKYLLVPGLALVGFDRYSQIKGK